MLRDFGERLFDRLRKVDFHEELIRVEIVFSGLVYYSDHPVFSSKRVFKHRIEFPEFERRRVIVVPDADSVVVLEPDRR